MSTTFEPGPGRTQHGTPTKRKLEALADPDTPTIETPPPPPPPPAAAAGSTSLLMDVLPDELIGEILSYLSVKTLMRLKTVSKAWKILISSPTFVNHHLQKSTRNPHFILNWSEQSNLELLRLLSLFPVRRLLNNPRTIDAFSNGVELKRLSSFAPYKEEYNRIVGSCNGLVCFYSRKVTVVYAHRYSEYWLNFRNLAMGTESQKLGHFLGPYTPSTLAFKFSFGYDNSNGTYKVVAFRGQDYDSPSWTSEVKIFNLGDNNNCWRNIQSFPVPPLICYGFGHSEPNDAVHLFGTINWLALTNTSGALHGWTHINAENFVILSLSLSTETYTQFLLPKGLNHDLHVQPTLRVLGNCLCFSHDFRRTEFVIWQMREFGVQESWTQLIKVSYRTLTLRLKNLPRAGHIKFGVQLLPLYLSENSNTLIFANVTEFNQALIYNRKDDRVERTRFSNVIVWFSVMDYVESLVPIA